MRKVVLITSFAAYGFLTSAWGQGVEAPVTVPPQPLADALEILSKQAGVQVLYGSEVDPAILSRGTGATSTTEDALRELLRGTGLTFEFVNPRTVTIRRVNGVGMSEVPHVGSDASSVAPESAVRTSATRADTAQLDEVTVTGTHIRGIAPVGSSLISLDREAIEKTGHTTVKDVVRTLPQNFNGGVSEDTPSRFLTNREAISNQTSATAVNLRGFGPGSTLVLVNGRRLAPSGAEALFTDISSIPLTAIERIDVMPDGASALYGSDAVGGVVNFILRRNYQGAETQARIGAVADGSLEEFQLGQVLGTNWSSGSALVSAEYAHRDDLPASERRLMVSDLRPFGGGNFDILQGNPGTIQIGSQTWAIPHGQDGRSLTGNDLVAGTSNLYNRNDGRQILPKERRLSVLATVQQELQGSVSLFADLMFSDRAVDATNPLIMTLSVPETNPFYVNPSGGSGPIRIAYNLSDDLGPSTSDIGVRSLNLVVGSNVILPGTWRLTGSAAYSGGDEGNETSDVDRIALGLALSDANPLTAFNPFGDGSHTNPLTLANLVQSNKYQGDSKLWHANVTADGNVATLPGGDVKLAMGADYRRQFFDSAFLTGGTPTFSSNLDRSVSAAYAEFFVPLIGIGNRVRGFERVELSIAGRHEQYSDFGGVTVPRLGVIWAPTERIAVRGSWSKSYKAPHLGDLVEDSNTTFIVSLPDPLSTTGSTDTLIWGGGNADLQEESARIWTAGVEFTIGDHPLFSGGVTYFHTEYNDRIGSVGSLSRAFSDPTLQNVAVFRNPSPDQIQLACTRSTFGGNFSGTPGDCSTTPNIAFIDGRTQNIALQRQEGVDLLASYELPTKIGRFTSTVNATYLLDYSQAGTELAPLVALLDTVGNPTDLRLRASVAWSRSPLSASVFMNYVDGYKDNISQPNRQISSWTTTDLNLSYSFSEGAPVWAQGARLSLSAQNVLDNDPPFYNNSRGVAYDPENADIIGRFIAVHLRKDW